MSANAEEKKTRTNLKKLGCLFEAFLGALFLDFNKISVKDEHNWFSNVFVSGPGFQIAQIFVESIFENHVNWTKLIQSDDNYKNILQVMLQKTFQVTPIYREISGWDEETGYNMGVYLCLDIQIHQWKPSDSRVETLEDLHSVNVMFDDNGKQIKKPLELIKNMWQKVKNDPDKGWVFLLGSSKHKIKKKAEQAACKLAISKLT